MKGENTMLNKLKKTTSIDTEAKAIEDILSNYYQGKLHISFDKLVEDINNSTVWHIVDESGDIWLTDY